MAGARREADWLAVGDARERVLAGVRELAAEDRPLAECLGSVLAADVVSPVALPPHDNSAMDGFAARAEDVRGAAAARPVELEVVGDVPAGGAPAAGLRPGEAVRVMTGAPVPAGADTVVRVEHTDGGEIGDDGRGRVSIRSDVDAGRNVRPRGEDMNPGDRVIPAGRVLRPAELGLAASVGRGELSVVRRPVVAVLTSGDELVDVSRFDEVLAGHRIVSSNSYTLAGQLAEIGAVVRDLGIAPDEPRKMRAMLEHARGADALVTSAGISMGERDLVLEVLGEMGNEVDFWRVRMKPGSPFAFGRVMGLGGIPWFGLPGNPVSSMVTFEVLVRPALLRMAGRTAMFAPTIPVLAGSALRTEPRLAHFLRVRLERDGDRTIARLAGAQGSGILSSMAGADALLVVPESAGAVEAGAALRAIVLGGAPLSETPGY